MDNELNSNDTQILLVDGSHPEYPLKHGEFYYDADKNILYCGKYKNDVIFRLWEYITHKTSFAHLPAPRIKTSFTAKIIVHSSNTQIEAALKKKLSFKLKAKLIGGADHTVLIIKRPKKNMNTSITSIILQSEHSTDFNVTNS